MIARIRRWFGDPLFLLLLVTSLVTLLAQSGELGTSDTQHRLQSSHSFWTAEPPVFPQEYPEFGVHGRGGQLQSWYGIGQSLLMLPSDIAGTYIERLPIFSEYDGTDPSVRNIFVSFSVNLLVSVLTSLVLFRFLLQLGFGERHALLGVLSLLFATTHLHYMQNMMENNYIFLLTLTGFSYQYQWLRDGSRRALLAGSAAFGLNLLTRLTTGLDLMAGGLFILLVLWLEGSRGRALWSRCREYLGTVLPVSIFFGLMDRLYQFHRFGSWVNTYVDVIAREARQRNPALPRNYPFENPFHLGFFGALFSPAKSIFLFDPLLILLLLIAILIWKRFSPAIQAYIIATLLLLLADISFYARYTVWSGDFAWGDRYVSTAAELCALLAVPLLLRYRGALGRGVFGMGIAILTVSTVIQLASLAFWMPLEIYQTDTLGHPAFVIGFRLRNIVAFAAGKMEAWGLNTEEMGKDPWDYPHITTWNFFPFLLRRIGVAPAWVVRLAFIAWSMGLAALIAALWRIRTIYSRLRT